MASVRAGDRLPLRLVDGEGALVPGTEAPSDMTCWQSITETEPSH
jgi:hypothetical protein